MQTQARITLNIDRFSRASQSVVEHSIRILHIEKKTHAVLTRIFAFPELVYAIIQQCQYYLE